MLGLSFMNVIKSIDISVFEGDVLPRYLAQTRWYPHRVAEDIRPTIVSAIPFSDLEEDAPWLVFFETSQQGATSQYVLALRIEWNPSELQRNSPRALTAVHQDLRDGILLDVATDPVFITLLLNNLNKALTIVRVEQRLGFRPTRTFLNQSIQVPKHIRAVSTEQSNSTTLVDSNYVVKLYRKLEPGINPEIEVGRFVTDVVGFANTPALLGSVELADGDSNSSIAVVHAFVENKGDAWTVMSGYLDNFVKEKCKPSGARTLAECTSLPYMSRIGQRVAEMHVALASSDKFADFVPEQTQPEDVQHWIANVMIRAERAFETLKQHRGSAMVLIDQVLAQRSILHEHLTGLFPADLESLNIRHHGDFHLGQVLVVEDDIFIIDFEGEPRRPLVERRRKGPAARDVAGLIRSIDYSATAAQERAVQDAHDEKNSDLGSALAEWRDRSVATFLTAYRSHMTDERLWPADPSTAQRVLDFFLLEKVLYEIDYELAHRPNWLHVPLRGMLRILSQRVEGVDDRS
jgi:maltose alpha-D-glucosyltransferase/alpha-amylase